MQLTGRVVLVFGAGSSGPGWGNGKAAAVLYARAGATVVAADRVLAAAAETASIITGEGGQALALAADVTSAASVDAVVAAVLAQFGRIDVLHNNVGITDMGDLSEITDERWARVMDINLAGAMRACRAVLPIMQAQGKGAIINISSLAGGVINTYPYFSYNASKAALNHFTRALAIQYGKQGIRSNAIMPGLMATPMVQAQIAGHTPTSMPCSAPVMRPAPPASRAMRGISPARRCFWPVMMRAISTAFVCRWMVGCIVWRVR